MMKDSKIDKNEINDNYVVEVACTKSTAWKLPSLGMSLTTRGEGSLNPGTSTGGRGSNSPAGGGAGSNPVASGGRPPRRSPAAGGKAPCVNLIHVQRCVPYD